VASGILHLGVGNFHRAHQALVADDALEAGDLASGVVGVSLRHSAMRDALQPQDGLYTVVERGSAGTRYRVCGALRERLVAPSSPMAVLDRFADPRIGIVTITVTEKGYAHDPASSGLDRLHPDVIHDLAHPREPRSTPGWIIAGLRARHARGGTPLTLLSCDNLTANGDLLARLLDSFARASGAPADFLAWLARDVACPNAMVDRIVPATTDALREEVRQALGVDDAWPVPTEAFSQWVIEDRFAGIRPAWERSGVQFVADVAPWEAMKLRLLNTAHSCLAYLGYPAGCETIPEARAVPEFAQFIMELWRDEVVHVLPAAARAERVAYCERLLERFSNAALGHRTRQIAQDGSQKLPMRLIPILRELRGQARPGPRTTLGIAAWMHYACGRTEHGERYAIEDPLASRINAIVAAAGDDPRALVRGFLAIETMFGPRAADDVALAGALEADVRALRVHGGIATVRARLGH